MIIENKNLLGRLLVNAMPAKNIANIIAEHYSGDAIMCSFCFYGNGMCDEHVSCAEGIERLIDEAKGGSHD